MKLQFLTLSLLILSSFANNSRFDITSREMTDPLLEISTSKGQITKHDLKVCTKGKIVIPEKRGEVFVYKKLLKKRNVISLHPYSPSEAAKLDFSAITSKAKGTLRVSANNHPQGDFEVLIKKDGKIIDREVLAKTKWKKFSVPFDNNKIVIEVAANGKQLHYEYGFIYYSVSK